MAIKKIEQKFWVINSYRVEKRAHGLREIKMKAISFPI